MTFQIGDVLLGRARSRDQARHPIIYLGGPPEAPLAVMVTHSNNSDYRCNIRLDSKYIKEGLDGKEHYFVAHRLQKLREWGPYRKVGEISIDGISFVESHLSDGSITWEDYVALTKVGCEHHK